MPARNHVPKRKVGPSRSKPRAFNPKESRIDRWNKPSDIPLDQEDQFHASRDKILLEDEVLGAEDDGDEDEVFALKGIPDDDSEEEDLAATDSDSVDQENVPPKKSSKSNGKKAKAPSPSSSDAESESEEEGWGSKKSAYYASNAAQLESDDEEANELEEQEALRLQAKTREDLTNDDFGLGDPVEGIAESDDMLVEASVPVVQPLLTDKYALLRHLEKTNPEALALARDWDDVVYQLVQAEEKIAKVEAESPDTINLGMLHLHHQTLLTYTTTLAFYLHLRASEKYAQHPELLRVHPILPRLLALKQALQKLEDLDFAPSDDDDDDDDDDELSDGDDTMADATSLWASDKKRGLEPSELEELLREAHQAISTPDSSPSPSPAPSPAPDKPKRKQSAPTPARPTKRRKTAPTVVFDLVEPELPARTKPRPARTPDAGAADVYGEAAALDAGDAADKRARRKSLRFHAARIEGTSARRAGARSGAVGGDDDIPYRERGRQKEERLAREGARGRGQGGEDLDGVEPEAGGREKKRPREEEGSGEDDGDGAEGYYALVQHASKARKETKKAEYDAARAAVRPNDDEDDADGPRGLTRAILKNKGLTPHRGKSVRNPRVKKRQKYDKAKKKISSQKAVYKGGLAETGRYDGEKSGISKVIKSVQL
ncbi:Sas10 C-terminal domain-containing protein [Amylocystis lapponica]|nr:Sas10 C-terminal domain-containing protein [Amylocystis lapponica]